MTLIFGGSSSGKSNFAEQLTVAAPSASRLYIATMQPWDDECFQRIQRHQRMRANRGFDTLECYRDLDQATTEGYGAVLLECVGNLLANEMYREDRVDEKAADRILKGIDRIRCTSEHIFIVSNDVHRDGGLYDRATMAYINAIAHINRHLASLADRVVEVVFGIPIWHKGVQS